MALKKIPTAEQSLLCASIYILNFKRAIEELVYNSLDAAASSIAIRICIQESFIQVLDNGNGISKDNFSLLGQKYATSKYVNINTLKSAPDKYGFRGLCLAIIIDVSENVQITSQSGNSNETWMKTFCNGKEKEICKTISRPSKGTTVQIKGFLYNLNIQRKSIDPLNELLNIKTALKKLSLVHLNVSLSLRDDYKNDIILQIHKRRTIDDTLQSVFKISEEFYQELQVEKNDYKVKAFIGKLTVESNNEYQYIYINGKYIHKSVLHRKFNESLSHLVSTRNNRRKDKHYDKSGGDKDNFYNCNFPFYFVFITCPNSDFVITYDSEKTLVEFKDWNELDKLVGKLIQFYSDGLLSKKKELNEIENEEKISDTRKEVKKIMNIFLNNHNKKTRISQLQNGKKGKILKRNRSKKHLSIQKVLNKKSEAYGSYNLNDFSNLPKVEISKLQQKQQFAPAKKINLKRSKSLKCMNNLLTIEAPNPHVHKNKIHEQNIFKNVDYKDSLVNKFKDPTATVRRRCKYLKRKVLKLLDKNILKKYSGIKNAVYTFINNETQYQTIHKNTGSLSLCQISNQELQVGNNIVTNNLNNRNIKKSSDLIKPVVHSSPYNLIETKNTVITHFRQSYGRKINYTCNGYFPMATYNSHTRNLEAFKEMGCSITETTRDYLFLHEKEIHPLSIKCNPAKSPVRTTNKIISKSNTPSKHSQEVQEYSCYTIEITDSHKMRNCRSTMSTVDHNIPQNNKQSDLVDLGNTYTLQDFIRTEHNNDNYETYSLKTFNTSNSRYHFEVIEPILNSKTIDSEIYNLNMDKHNFVLPESESENIEIMHNNEDPINDYETEQHSLNNKLKDFENEIENEIEKSLVHRRDDTLYNCNFDEIQQSINNFESIQDFMSRSVNVFNNHNNREGILDEADTFLNCKHFGLEAQSLKMNKNKVDSEPIYNFQIKRRLRFMPKGMSPIANNQGELQNKSTNDDEEEYYKDMIYKNFAKNVLLNTEIYEPEVQNVTNLFSNNKEKLNSEMQTQNADIIFDSLSLTQAKILGQVDRKFIASMLNGRLANTTKTTEFLVLFDQHAVDERIRLENNLSDYIQNSVWKSIDIDPVSIVLSKDDYVYFMNHKDKLARFGLQWTFTSESEIMLKAIPNAILGKNPRKVEVVMKAVKKLILEEFKAIKSLRGNISLYPKSIMELVFSEACRYAIKFGDKLTKSECANLINSLAYCKTPFQCAHGRLDIAVLMELKNKSRSYEINLINIKQFGNVPTIDGCRKI